MSIHTLQDLCYAYRVADPVREMLFALQDRIDALEAQRKPLSDEEIMSHEWILSAEKRYEDYTMQESIVAVGAVEFARAIEAAHNIKEKT